MRRFVELRQNKLINIVKIFYSWGIQINLFGVVLKDRDVGYLYLYEQETKQIANFNQGVKKWLQQKRLFLKEKQF